ncbi:hypothetical protein [Halobacillus trueperi]|uniref:hypothetical protein n=1 Tax=Halobacillus trueperi TaxID=156205 RepID=UPI00373639ED
MKNKVMFSREAARKNVCTKSYPPIPIRGSRILDLSSVVDQYSQLKLKAGWRIYTSFDYVYAMANEETDTDDLMAGITGDESPLSYLQAAVCYHHLMEYSVNKTDLISQAILDDDYLRQLNLMGKWNIRNIKRSLNPVFFYDSLMHPVVILFTYHQEGIQVIQKHIHRFNYGSYKLKTLQRNWAILL